MPAEDPLDPSPLELAERLRQNVERLRRSVEGLSITTALLSVELQTLTAFCFRLAATVGLSEIDGVNAADWIDREKRRRMERLLTGIEDVDPGMAAHLQAAIDQATGPKDGEEPA